MSWSVKEVRQKLVEQGFREWWEAEKADRALLRAMINDVRDAMGWYPFTWDEFDEGWQWCTVFQEDYESSLDEAVHLCIGWR